MNELDVNNWWEAWSAIIKTISHQIGSNAKFSHCSFALVDPPKKILIFRSALSHPSARRDRVRRNFPLIEIMGHYVNCAFV